jgi:hypothetical protein
LSLSVGGGRGSGYGSSGVGRRSTAALSPPVPRFALTAVRLERLQRSRRPAPRDRSVGWLAEGRLGRPGRPRVLMPEVAPEFLTSARAFRAALVADDVEDGTFARHVRNALARVYLSAALLGLPTTVEGDDPPDRQPRSGESGTLRERLQARFGESDVFVEVYDPSRLTDDDVKPFERLLSSELVEVDVDIAEAIAWLRENRANALWDIRWAFENHWGQHALACLRPLHQIATYGVV